MIIDFDPTPEGYAERIKAAAQRDAGDIVEKMSNASLADNHTHLKRRIEELTAALRAAEERAERAESMAAQTKAAQDVLAERTRQIAVEGWSDDHDDDHDDWALSRAAGCYAFHPSIGLPEGFVPTLWPWDGGWWKPTTPRRDLVKAAALILAEIERLDRMEQKGGDA